MLMDTIVQQALQKWPDVPHCYGWLGLDARGNWRMRDEQAQKQQRAGDKIKHPALLAFIARNYLHDERGCWFFQNGPQRVYVQLEATPFIARTCPDGESGCRFALHTAHMPGPLDALFMNQSGQLIVVFGDIHAQLDDRDMAEVMAALEIEGHSVSDDALLAWLDGAATVLTLRQGQRLIEVQHIKDDNVSRHFGFVRQPAPGPVNF